MTSTAFAMVPFGSNAEESSADEYGYHWTDSNSPEPTIPFSWIDITATGSSLGFYYSDDEYYTGVPIGFEFEFYGNTYTSLNVTSNGLIQFGGASTDGSNDALPGTSDPDNFIAPYWDDLAVYYPGYNYGQVYYQTIGVSPNARLIIEFYEVSRDYDYDHLTFEVILLETGEIVFQYLTLNGETGSGATIGIENIDGTFGCPYSYNTASLTDGLAVMFELGLIGFGPDRSNTVAWGTSSVYSLSVTNGQAVTDSFDIKVNSTVLGWSVTLYDLSYALLIDNNLDSNGYPDTGDIAPGASFSMLVYVTVPSVPSGQNETTVLLASSFLDPTLNDTATLRTTAVQGVLVATHTTNGYDDDLDGDYDYLQVNVSVQACDGGNLGVYVYLYTSDWDGITNGYGSMAVAEGFANITVYLSGESVYGSLFDGSLIVELYLYDRSSNYIDYGSFLTGTYYHDDFEPPAATLIPPTTDYAVDSDSDGLFNYVVVEVTFEVFDEGTYRLETQIYDGSWNSVSYSENESYYTAGVYVVLMVFPGIDFYEVYVDEICWLYVDLYMDDIWTDYLEGDTSYYYYEDFEGPGVYFSPPHYDYATDADVDGYYDTLTIEVYFDCTEDGIYDLNMVVYDPWGYTFEYVNEWGLSLTAGTGYAYAIVLDGNEIWLNGISGYFEVYMYLY